MSRLVMNRMCTSIVMRCLQASVLVGVALSLSGLFGCEARGRIDRATPHWFAPQPVEAVELYFGERQPAAPGMLVAYVSAEADTRRFGTVEEARAAAYDKLRALAAEAGAHAVVDIEQSIVPHAEPAHEVIRVRGEALRLRGR